LIKQSNLLAEESLNQSLNDLFKLLKSIYNDSTDLALHSQSIYAKDDNLGLEGLLYEESIEPEVEELQNSKKLSRKYMNSFTNLRVSVTIIRNLYLIAHLTAADLSIMNDFNDFKDYLSIVNKSFVTLGKGFVFDNTIIHLRDTMLLAPGGNKSLKAIGKMYDQKLTKVELSRDEIANMDKLLKEDRSKFINYALTDSLITLIHGLAMDRFNGLLGSIGVPLTLSSLGAKYVKRFWMENDYDGYQISPIYLLGDASVLQTPLGLSQTKDIGFKLNLYIANYKGGRNESYMYGVDRLTT
jgi:hypothetical protein